MTPVALGLRAHSGWAALVAVAGSARSPEIVERCRIELIDPGAKAAAQPYHAAAEMERPKAEKFIADGISASRAAATRAFQDAIKALKGKGFDAVACGILLSSARPLPALSSILASHALIHTAEGEFFRDALAYASKQCGLPVSRIPERDVFAMTAAHSGATEEELKCMITDLGRRIGPPWRQDEKLATLVAALALNARAVSR